MTRFSFSPLAFLRRWLKYPLTPLRQVSDWDKAGLHFREVRNLYCNCLGCSGIVHCHGLCKEHRDEKRKLGYKC